MTARARRSEAGYTLVELLVSTAIMLSVTGAIFTLVNPSQGSAAAQPEIADLQQRMRVGSETFFKELVIAGAGPYQGPTTGSLINFFAPIIPRRTGLLNADPSQGAGSFKPDVITIAYMPSSYTQTSITRSMPKNSAELKVADIAGCPKGLELCGFEEGMSVIIFDKTGNFDTFLITRVQHSAGHLQHRGVDLSYDYDAGAVVTQISSYTYYLDRTTNELKRYDGGNTEEVLVSDVVDLQFEYFGDAHPPRQPKPPPGIANCLYDASGNYKDPGTLPLTDGSLAALSGAILSDGPYCGAGDNQCLQARPVVGSFGLAVERESKDPGTRLRVVEVLVPARRRRTSEV